jgi:hypothetical protein
MKLRGVLIGLAGTAAIAATAVVYATIPSNNVVSGWTAASAIHHRLPTIHNVSSERSNRPLVPSAQAQTVSKEIGRSAGGGATARGYKGHSGSASRLFGCSPSAVVLMYLFPNWLIATTTQTESAPGMPT